MSSPAASPLPAPVAPRLRRPSWRDTRLLVGVVLVLASVVLGASVVAAADDTVAVYAARDTLAPGDPIRPGDVAVVRARIVTGADRYLSATSELPPGLVALRTVGAGELLPSSALGNSAELELKPVAVPYADAVPSGLVKGALVDVWISLRDAERAGAFDPPERVVEAAEVAEVTSASGTLGAGRASAVQVLLAESQLAQVLDALANDARVAVVVVPGSAPARGES